ASEGVVVTLLGVVPTPAVAHAAAARGVPGAMISASHNPFPDNGIKLFAPGGRKLADEDEDQLEAELAHLLGSGGGDRPTGAGVGTVTADDGRLARAYADDLHRAIGGRRLDGLSVVLDCAHGAA